MERLLPKRYQDLKHIFSKAASDKLPPHRPYDHKIELEAENTLSYCPLYKQSETELLATKKYLTENLPKGFIVPSQAPFASPILFVKKGERKPKALRGLQEVKLSNEERSISAATN